MNSGGAERSKQVVGLFLAATLALTPGCSLNPFDWGRDGAPCTDANRDGYCDEDGRPVPRSGGRYYRSGFWGSGRSSSGSNTSVSSGSSSSHGVSSGSKGGIGSSSRSSGG